MSGPLTPVIRVLVVDDSPVARELLAYLLNSDPALEVIGVVADGEQAVEAAARLRPDVITMDIHLPRLDGYAATRMIMETCPTRIVMVTASPVAHEVADNFRVLEAGALAVLAKPSGPGHPEHAQITEELLRTIKLMAEVSVVRRWRRSETWGAGGASASASAAPAPAPVAGAELRLVVIGASTGGPLALHTILARLKQPFAAPILVVQHISPGFVAGLVEWLGRGCGGAVRVAGHGELALAGNVYLAPDDAHMTVRAEGGVARIALSSAPAEHGARPAVAQLFHSAAAFGPRAAGVLLTGMGRDGAQELLTMQQAGALTIAQDADSAIVNGMPGEAVRLGAARHVLAPEAIAGLLNSLTPGAR
ncbi:MULTISPECIES: chemotaxis-specific protein-glutamate methyltransferase CheB [unclassified Duganella]|uniref:chemotaxis-specific protein-glutamate methyltransferase CheB n=1 Tax=unclassified Duganella TaxID=2636909 RepID=UPI000E353394|nr:MULTISPECIES: chemotaxis-specific protein-glutamate methyltransferase CheB [unclassified Duganella]RFP14780.1 chemotaxis-specific protein-glutamate methyltransferase CheB [Duganella sp. BJB475]RFP31129.1 chemotaxis-specific protein-glutamate methyltransferase CheB [Duganella sp. BJB476]